MVNYHMTIGFFVSEITDGFPKVAEFSAKREPALFFLSKPIPDNTALRIPA